MNYAKWFIILSIAYSQCDYNDDGQLNVIDIVEQINCILTDCWSIDSEDGDDYEDTDNNTYSTILINDKLWMSENLRTTHYSNGDPITNLEDDYTHGLYYEGYSNYDGDILYNFFAVEDERNICPAEWHVSTDIEWAELLIYLGMSYDDAWAWGHNGDDEGDMLKHDAEWNGTNETGFNALPAGSFSYCGSYPPTYCEDNKDYLGQFWTISDDGSSWYRGVDWNRSDVQHQTKDRWAGKSVRCVKD